MTKKDYIKFAKMILEQREAIHRDEWDLSVHELKNETVTEISERLAVIFAADNPNFDRSRFLKACGLE